MSVFSRFVGWINLNIQQPLEAESQRSENVESNSVSEKDTKTRHVYYDKAEAKKQGKLWNDAPAKVKVTTKKGLCHMHIELTVGLPPEGVYDLFANPNNIPFFRIDNETGRGLMVNKSRKILKKDGPRQIARLEKAVAFDFLWWFRAFPFTLIVDENQKDFTKEMNVFPGFGGWINQNIQQPSKAESKRSENVTANSVSEKDTNNQELHYDKEEMKKQYELWSASEKKHPWSDPPPKVKVTTKKGICHMNIELTMGWIPDGVFELFTNPNNGPLFFDIDGNGRQLLEYKSRKVLKKDGPRQIVKVEQAVAWNLLWWSEAFPISLIVDENVKDHTAKYKKEKMMFMKVFEGSWKIEPLYVDSDRLCKHKEPQSVEEYRKCSGGQGRTASKVTMDQ